MSQSSKLDRRSFLKRTGMAGAAAAVVSRLPAPGAASAQDATVRPDPAAKRGGTLRYAVHNAPAHFDVHQSGTVANIGPQSPMYDTLLRRSPRDGQTIIPDLAWKYEISPDNKKYTFHLRKGVKFHDGADFTAEDVKATYDRIARPPKGVVIPRSPLFATVGEIVVVNPESAVGWLEGSGLTVDDGVVCDGRGATGTSGIVAVGDCARWHDGRPDYV